MRHVFAVTPIHVDEVELGRRRRRYADLAPDGLAVHLVDIGPDAPSRLETAEDLRASEKAVAAALGGAEAARYDVRLPDCVLDPGVPAEPARDAPRGMLRLCLEHLAGSGHRVAAVTRNAVIGEELQRRAREYGFTEAFLGVRVLDLDVGSIADPDRWHAATAGALRELGARGATAVINGCSAVDVAPASGAGPRVVDPAATALRLLGSGTPMSDVDLLVAGAGGGLAGALRAAQHGLSVLVVEANEHYLRGNNTSMSTAMVPGAGSRYQRAAGIEDSPELFLADIRRKTHGDVAETAARALAGVSAELVEWLADHVGVPVELPVDFSYPGHSRQRVHTLPGRHGSRLLRYLSDAARDDAGVDMLVPCRLGTVHRRGDGELVAVLEQPGGGREEVTAGAVLLATNGYGAAPNLVAEHLPEIAGATYHGSEHSTGDALRIGTALGAATAYLDAYQGHAGLSAAARTLVTWTTVMHGAVVLDADGRRFGDESTGYSEYAATLAARPGATGWLVFDSRIHELSLAFADFRDVAASGAVHTAGSVDELAAAIGVPAGTLAAELAEAADVARGARGADRFGREAFEQPLAPPLAAVRIVPALFHSQGGLAVDGHARVLDRHGVPIPGLYAAGGAAAGISGHGAAGYLAGNGLLPALGLSYLAATHAAGDPEPAALARSSRKDTP